jgi:hypothetical protein
LEIHIAGFYGEEGIKIDSFVIGDALVGDCDTQEWAFHSRLGDIHVGPAFSL